jgi:hypothetical protein
MRTRSRYRSGRVQRERFVVCALCGETGAVTFSAAEVGSIADGIDMYRSRVAGLAEPLVGSSNEDLIAALHEAERALRNAHRAMRHAIKLSNAL